MNANMTNKLDYKPRKSSFFNNYRNSVYFAFKTDIEDFLEKFEKEKTLNYADFASIWQLKNFTFIFADQSAVKHLKILCQVCFTTVKKYITRDSSVYTAIGAFYLLYGLYYKQPVRNLVKIRLVLEEFRKLKSLMNEMQTKGQYDALYIFAKMMTDGAFLFVAQPKTLSLLARYTGFDVTEIDDPFKYKESAKSLIKFEDLLKDETVLSLEKTCGDYETKLKNFASQNSGPVPFKSNIIGDLKEIHQQVCKDQAAAPLENHIANRRKAIRDKAMANTKAEYRGSRKVPTAMDLEDDSESD